jgi:membrane protease YdiL (CAAX protease family)
MLIMALGRSLGAGADDKRVNLLANNISQIAGALACLMVAQRWFEGGARTFVRGPPRCSALRLVSTAILFWLVSLPLGEVLLKSVQHIFTRLWPDYVFPQHVVVEALLGGAEPLWFVVLLWLGAAVIAPIAEEIFFRGILQTAIVDLSSRALFPARARASRWVGVIVAGVAFGLSHMAQWHAVPALALFGILLGVAYERTGSLVPPILMHALFNLTTLVSVALGRAGE